MISEKFPLSGPAEVDVSSPAGSIIVEPGPSDTAVVSIDTKRPEDWEVSCTGDSLIVHFQRGGWRGGGRARIRIGIPEESSLRVGTASADVRASMRLGRVSISTASGEVRMDEADRVAIKTASGDVSLGAAASDLAVKSASGDVRVGRVDGSATITTASGDTILEEAYGSLTASSASGDVYVRRYLGDDLEANTMSGDVTVGLPSGIRVRLQATTLSGDVSLPRKRSVETGAGARNVTIKAKSVSGDISITRI